MANVTAQRRFDNDFLDALEYLARSTSEDNWWRDVLAHPDLVIAVRNNSLNVYYWGASIFKIEWKRKSIVPKTHVKYLIKNKQTIIPLKNGNFDYKKNNHMIDSYTKEKTLKSIINSSKRFSGNEKRGLHLPLVGNNDLIDVELSLSMKEEEEENTEQLDPGGVIEKNHKHRLDAAAVRLGAGNIPTIFFCEAKDFTNTDLRATGDEDPDVLNQIASYERSLRKHSEELSAWYLKVARALVRIDTMRQAVGNIPSRAGPLLRQIAENDTQPSIDIKPHLLIYGFDEAQRDHKEWKDHHYSKLQTKLDGRIKAKGALDRKDSLFS